MFKIGAHSLVFDEQGRILLVHRRDMDKWNLPGGGVEDGEAPWEAAVREVKEESGFDVAMVRMTGVYYKPRENEVCFSFLCRIVGGHATLNDEADRIEFFEMDALPPNTSARQVERIADYLSDKSVVHCKRQE